MSFARLDHRLQLEWDSCHEHARDQVLGELRSMGAGSATLDHVANLRLYYRVAFLLSCWATDASTRRRLSADLATHVVSMKLLDDLVDADSNVDPYELGGGCLHLLLLATDRLTRYQSSAEAARILHLQANRFKKICKGQLACKHSPATDFESWLRYADDYGSGFLGVYGRLGGIASGLGERSVVSEDFARSFGLIITIADDLTDYTRHRERVGNLGAMLVERKTSVGAIESVLERERSRASEAARALPTAHALAPVVDSYCDDVRRRILPDLSTARG